VVVDGTVVSFALNMEMPEGQPDQRVALGKAALTLLGLLPE
jgi:hypothetical protein